MVGKTTTCYALTAKSWQGGCSLAHASVGRQGRGDVRPLGGEKLTSRFLRAIHQLRQVYLQQLMQLGETLHAWSTEIATMWRFTCNNSIMGRFHTKTVVV